MASEAQGQAPERILPAPFDTSTETFDLVAQGAESLLYRTTFLTSSRPAALKVRPEKKWRHPTLDKRLTRQRVLAEARVLVKLSGEGIASGGGGRKVKDPKPADGALRGLVPAVLALDWERGWLVTEWIEGGTVKQGIYDHERGRGEQAVRELLGRIGNVVGLLHKAGVVHGDLTTSNMMLRPHRTPTPSSSDSIDGPAATHERTDDLVGDIVLIDFGLATQSVSDEDRAVDLYVLERAFGSTHPKEEGMFEEVLKGYGESMGKTGKVVLRRLEDVRMRGRKKSMLG